MDSTRRLTLPVLFFILGSGFINAMPFNPGGVHCRAELDRAVLPAGEKQRAIIKVTLEAPRPPKEADRPPVNIAIVLDSSSSMNGEKIQKAKEAAIEAARRLGVTDIFSLVIYSNQAQTLFPAQKVRSFEEIERTIQAVNVGGMTALFAGVSQGAAEVRKNLGSESVHRILLLSDGLANVGPSAPDDLARLGAALLKEQISVTSVGLGSDFNEDLMTRLSQMSDGNAYYVAASEDLPGIFAKELGEVLSVVAKKVVLTIECRDGVRPIALIGREGRIQGQTASISLNQLYGSQEKYALLEVEVDGVAAGETRTIAEATLTYLDPVSQEQRRTAEMVGARFSAKKEAVAASINKEVQRAYYLNGNALTQDDAIALADQGKIAEAAQALEQSGQNLENIGKENADPVLLKKAEEMRRMAQEIEQKGVSKEQRKALRTDSYQLRNQQSVPEQSPPKKKDN